MMDPPLGKRDATPRTFENFGRDLYPLDRSGSSRLNLAYFVKENVQLIIDYARRAGVLIFHDVNVPESTLTPKIITTNPEREGLWATGNGRRIENTALLIAPDPTNFHPSNARFTFAPTQLVRRAVTSRMFSALDAVDYLPEEIATLYEKLTDSNATLEVKMGILKDNRKVLRAHSVFKDIRQVVDPVSIEHDFGATQDHDSAVVMFNGIIEGVREPMVCMSYDRVRQTGSDSMACGYLHKKLSLGKATSELITPTPVR